jgi:hypothetical protein
LDEVDLATPSVYATPTLTGPVALDRIVGLAFEKHALVSATE